MNARIALLSGLLWLCSCSTKPIDEVLTDVTVETPTIVLPENPAGGEQHTTATFTTTAPWHIELSDTKTADDWVHVSPLSGEAGTVTLTIDADENRTPIERTAYIRLLTGSEERSISLTQPGDGSLPAGESIYRTGVVQETLVVKLPAGRTYRTDLEGDDGWLSAPILATGERFDSLSFVLSTNRTMEERTATVRIETAEGDYAALLTIIQPSAALDITLSLPHVQLPTGGSSFETLAEWIDSLFVAGFDNAGRLLFTQNIPQAGASSYRFQVMPPESLLQNFYPEARIYVVANGSQSLAGFGGDEQEFINKKDTARARLFGVEGVQPPFSGVAVRDLASGPNEVALNLAHVTAQVTFQVVFDSTWTADRTIEQVNVGGFSTWGYWFTSATETATSPLAQNFNPSVEPNADNQYRVFAYENSRPVLTLRVGGRYYQGTAPDLLKRGYKYTLNMRLANNGSTPAASAQANLAPTAGTSDRIERTVLLRPI